MNAALPELFIILALVIILFGPARLADVIRAIRGALRYLQRRRTDRDS